MDPEGVDVCFTGSFSKILGGPGLRLGWMLVPESIYRKCELIKQSIDACSPSISQVIADKFIRGGGYIHDYTESVRKEYRKRGGLAMTETLEKCLPHYVSFEKPRGGFYTWLHLPEGNDSAAVLKKPLKREWSSLLENIRPDGIKNNNMRVSFCNTDVGTIHRGIPLLAEAIREVFGS